MFKKICSPLHFRVVDDYNGGSNGIQLFLTRLKQNLKKVIVPIHYLLIFLFNKYVSSVVHHGHPAGERGFYTNF